jgi:hypothetical protein
MENFDVIVRERNIFELYDVHHKVNRNTDAASFPDVLSWNFPCPIL